MIETSPNAEVTQAPSAFKNGATDNELQVWFEWRNLTPCLYNFVVPVSIAGSYTIHRVDIIVIYCILHLSVSGTSSPSKIRTDQPEELFLSGYSHCPSGLFLRFQVFSSSCLARYLNSYDLKCKQVWQRLLFRIITSFQRHSLPTWQIRWLFPLNKPKKISSYAIEKIRAFINIKREALQLISFSPGRWILCHLQYETCNQGDFNYLVFSFW